MRTLSALFALALVACGGSGKDGDSASSTPTGDPTTTSTPGGTPGGTPTGTTSTTVGTPTTGTATGTGPTDPDDDGDGSPASLDCDDSNPAMYPGNPEVCDGLDNDCANGVDDGLSFSQYYEDADGDGQGDVYSVVDSCDGPPTGYVNDGSDCDDNDASVFFGAPEVCDTVDNDCDGSVDEGVTTTFYTDADGDGYGNLGAPIEACATAPGIVADATDCNDGNASTYPGATEQCDAQDNDCDLVLDNGIATAWYADNDGDGHGNPYLQIDQCPQPVGYVANDTDCDDAEATTYLGATEVCDDVDNDCDAQTDEGLDLTWYADSDGDGYGDPTSTLADCAQPVGYVADATDCNDAAATAYPGGTEICDGLDNDCANGVDDGLGGTWYEDLDGDGHGSLTVAATACTQPPNTAASNDDCNDADPGIHPGADTRVCDLVDTDCSGGREELIVPDDGSLASVLNTQVVPGDVVCITDPSNTGPYVIDVDNLLVEGVGGLVEIGIGNGPGITITNGLTAELRNLTLIGSNAPAGQNGGGLFLWDDADVTLIDVVIHGNTAETQGGGIYVSPDAILTMEGGEIANNSVTGNGMTTWMTGGGLTARSGAEVTLRDVVVRDNIAWADDPSRYARGGAIGSDGATLVLEDVLFHGNRTLGGEGSGGALWVRNGSTLDATRVDLRANASEGDSNARGGALFLEQSTGYLTNVIFAGNETLAPFESSGSAIYASGLIVGSHLTMVGNHAEGQSGGGAWYTTGLEPTVDHLILQENTSLVQIPALAGAPFASLTHSSTYANDHGDWALAPTVGIGLLVATDAQFAGLVGGSMGWDLHLSPSSPLIDAGTGTDPDGSTADIGAYGGTESW